MAQNQKFYKSRHTGKEIDDAIDSIGQIDKEIPTDIGLDSNGKLILEHDGQEITGQKKTVDFNSKVSKISINQKLGSIVYGRSSSGVEEGVNYRSSAQYGGDLVYRDTNGRAQIKDPVNNLEIANKQYVDIADNNKLDKTGGNISGDLTVQGDLKVNGTTTTVDTETLQVKDNIIVTNSEKKDLIDLSGLAINVNNSNTFGIMYDPTTNTVDLGLGSIDTNGKFTYNENEGLPLVIRDLNDTFTQDHLISWSTDKNKVVDSGIEKSKVKDLADHISYDNRLKQVQVSEDLFAVDKKIRTNNVIIENKDIQIFNNGTIQYYYGMYPYDSSPNVVITPVYGDNAQYKQFIFKNISGGSLVAGVTLSLTKSGDIVTDTNLKTVNGEKLVGTGDITIPIVEVIDLSKGN